jgi:hypothetical protein
MFEAALIPRMKKKKRKEKTRTVACIRNPSYTEGGDQED